MIVMICIYHSPLLQPGLQILEALAASGLRSIRYALEVPRAHSVLANDFSPEAFRSMTRNIRHNGVQDKVKPSCREARSATMLLQRVRICWL